MSALHPPRREPPGPASGRPRLRLVPTPVPVPRAGAMMRARLGRAWRIAKGAVQGFMDDGVPRLGAALSYYAVFSMAPLLILVLAVASLVFDAGQSRDLLLAQVSGLAGTEAAGAVQLMLDNADWRRDGRMATLIALGVVLVGASAVTSELRDALDHILGLPDPRRERPIWYGLVAMRLRSLSLVLVVGLLLLASLVVSAALSAAGTWAGGSLPGMGWLLEALNIVVSLVVVGGLYFWVYRFFPERRPSPMACALGAVVAALLFTAGKQLIGRYIGAAGVGSTFGAAGSLAVIMIWVYWTSQIVLFGAEVVKAAEKAD